MRAATCSTRQIYVLVMLRGKKRGNLYMGGKEQESCMARHCIGISGIFFAEVFEFLSSLVVNK